MPGRAVVTAEPQWPASSTGYRFICHHCVWCWPVHPWLLFDFELARWAHRRHMRRVHGMRPVGDEWGCVRWVDL